MRKNIIGAVVKETHGNGMPAKTKTPRTKTRKPHATRRRANTSAIAMMPYEVAEQLLISERETYSLMALGPERGGIRAMCLGDPNSKRPRKVVHREDFSVFVEFKRGKITQAEYVRRVGGKA